MKDFGDANWFSLEQSIKDRNVIPIIGPDALMVEYEDQADVKCTLPFYQLITKDLLEIFQVEVAADFLNDTWVLPKAVTAILANKNNPGSEQRLRREIARLISYYSSLVKPADSLCQLATIPAFNLFVSLTPDNLLERAITTNPVKISAFSPREASESLSDLLPLRQDERGIFQLFGACGNVGSGFAIHEEDALEYLYRLQSDTARRFTGILSELRRRDLLFIGCNFPDWLGRAILRLVNDSRLYAKETYEFLYPAARDADFNAFLTQYSPNSLAFYDPPEAFINKLLQNFTTTAPVKSATVSQQSLSTPNANAPTVFVSYASENTEAARRIADTLLTLGFADVWLDKKKLVAGDDWSNRIEEAIERCDFFMPLLSKEADARRSGVFWEEWDAALRHARRIKDVYLLPVGIDLEPASKKAYRRISDGETAAFFDKHLIHAPSGLLQPSDKQALMERCRRFMEAN